MPARLDYTNVSSRQGESMLNLGVGLIALFNAVIVGLLSANVHMQRSISSDIESSTRLQMHILDDIKRGNVMSASTNDLAGKMYDTALLTYAGGDYALVTDSTTNDAFEGRLMQALMHIKGGKTPDDIQQTFKVSNADGSSQISIDKSGAVISAAAYWKPFITIEESINLLESSGKIYTTAGEKQEFDALVDTVKLAVDDESFASSFGQTVDGLSNIVRFIDSFGENEKTQIEVGSVLSVANALRTYDNSANGMPGVPLIIKDGIKDNIKMVANRYIEKLYEMVCIE